MDLESVKIVKEDENIMGKEKIEKIDEMLQQTSDDTVDCNNNICNKNDKINEINRKKLSSKLENDNRIELRNFNQFLNNNYGMYMNYKYF